MKGYMRVSSGHTLVLSGISSRPRGPHSYLAGNFGAFRTCQTPKVSFHFRSPFGPLDICCSSLQAINVSKYNM